MQQQRLLKQFANAASEYYRMQSAQLAALLNGENRPFDQQIAEAAIRRDNVKCAILAHRQKHGC